MLEQLREEEERLQFGHFCHERAWALGCALKAAAEARRGAVAIDISLNGQTLFQYAMPGTTLDNLDWVRRKRNVVQRYQRSSWYIKCSYEAKGKSLAEASLVDPADYGAFGGAFPLRVRGVGVVGAITVSGLPQVEDHRLITDVLEQFLSSDEKRT
ncbi:heme-degrading domain-containing protein [Aeromonas jandaei]|uniref:heme-degrading domain-containing protein n=1 Tax=Aeromonas veronii TaxID=654 RepID=UPI001E2BC1A0|nr:heme-degrading domain-containing protein [Aeromonas veronii]MCD6618896.1 heme-degrading domain-containing protein [Aeromonas veronii]